jgi:hypothetical protein
MMNVGIEIFHTARSLNSSTRNCPLISFGNRVTRDCNLKLIIPTDEKIKDFEKTVGSLILKKEINYNQIQTLKQTRDTLFCIFKTF